MCASKISRPVSVILIHPNADYAGKDILFICPPSLSLIPFTLTLWRNAEIEELTKQRKQLGTELEQVRSKLFQASYLPLIYFFLFFSCYSFCSFLSFFSSSIQPFCFSSSCSLWHNAVAGPLLLWGGKSCAEHANLAKNRAQRCVTKPFLVNLAVLGQQKSCVT